MINYETRGWVVYSSAILFIWYSYLNIFAYGQDYLIYKVMPAHDDKLVQSGLSILFSLLLGA